MKEDEKYDGGQAFPVGTASGMYEGMSLRDWFAGMALQSVKVVASDITPGHRDSGEVWPEEYATWEEFVEDALLPSLKAKEAYEIADALLAVRQK